MTDLTYQEAAFAARFQWSESSKSEAHEERTGVLRGVPVWYRVSTNPSGPLGASRSTIIRFRVGDGSEGEIHTMGGRGRAAQEAKTILREHVALLEKDAS